MPSLRQLFSEHAPLLLLDATSARIQVGLWQSESEVRWATSDEESGVGLFQSIAALEVKLSDVRSFAFADGPGSVLGIRTAAVAIRTWCAIEPRPVYSYGSLALAAAASPRPGGTFIADARRGAWHSFREGGPLQRVATADLTPPLITLQGFRHWTPLPAGVEEVPYDLADLFPRVIDADLFRPAPEPDAFLHEEPSYVTWTPQIHRAP
jgi:tRNA threonylcarbamoyladenosine biosynthesis protein TsaB